MNLGEKSNAKTLFAFVVVSVAVVGYFTGLQGPMQVTARNASQPASHQANATPAKTEVEVVPATHYAEMASVTRARRSPTSLASLKSIVDPLAEFQIDPQKKLAALQRRARNRAFNGAPPTIPHAISQRSDASCTACHQAGALTKSLQIPRMSHAFLANCTQCHVESNPKHMAAAVFVENEFAGLPAPTAGPRAFEGAPPQIPHTTWMRSSCMSCHGYEGLQGLRTTHPWRHNCQQCHTPSATMEQVMPAAVPRFLPGPEVRESL